MEEKLLGPSREQIFTGIAEVWLGQNSTEEDWGQKQGTKLKGCSPGVVCFIKDLDKENFQLWVISMAEGNVAWKQNIDKIQTSLEKNLKTWLIYSIIMY